MKSLKYIWLSAVALLSIGFASCNDDDEYFDDKYQSTPITITKVYLEDVTSSVPDREVTFARLGQTLRLEGSGFMGMKHVYINGYDTYFNRAYVSDKSMIIVLNSKTPITDADESVRNTIVMKKDKAEFSYDFTIRSASPTVTGINLTLPLPGEKVIVSGTGLEEITRITLPGNVVITEGIESDVDGKWYSFTMPSDVTEGGHITAEGANGTSQSPDYFNNTYGMIINFDGTGTQGYWGSTNKDEDGNIKAGVSMIYPEDLVDDPLGTGRGKCFQVVPDRLLNVEGGIMKGKSRVTECWTAGTGNDEEDWTRMTPHISATAPLTEVALQFDLYIPSAWSTTGQIQICLINNYNWAGYTSDDNNKSNLTYFYIPWVSGGTVVPFMTDGWQTITIPLSSFAKYKAAIEDKEVADPTFQTVIDDRNAATYKNFGIGFVNADFTMDNIEHKSTAFTGPRMYIDNVRIVPCKTVTISDYPEDEE